MLRTSYRKNFRNLCSGMKFFPGVLAIPISRLPRDYLILFRKEYVHSVTWAGNPEKKYTSGPNGVRLTPRQSFEAWKQEVTGQSERWTETQTRIAESVRVSLIEGVLKLSETAHQERQSLLQRQELLIAELNHRVRNILSLVRGIVTQSNDTSLSKKDFTEVVIGRIQALARAHDQITLDSWGPGGLKTLINNEISAYVSKKAERILLSGENVMLSPDAFSTVALVFHELVTNSVKYGSLSKYPWKSVCRME